MKDTKESNYRVELAKEKCCMHDLFNVMARKVFKLQFNRSSTNLQLTKTRTKRLDTKAQGSAVFTISATGLAPVWAFVVFSLA